LGVSDRRSGQLTHQKTCAIPNHFCKVFHPGAQRFVRYTALQLGLFRVALTRLP